MILVLGATGILGSTLVGRLGSRQAVAAAREQATIGQGFKKVVLSDAGVARDFDWEDITAVINAAGTTRGTDEQLHKANVSIPISVAKQALAHGVQRFVQVSSFSIYGDVEKIGKGTPVHPITPYGRSKALADEFLMGMTNEGLDPVIVRFPLMFSADHPGLLRPLISFARRLRVMPLGAEETHRSMITYHTAARVLIAASGGMCDNVTCAAEIQSFNYQLLAKIMQDECKFHINDVPFLKSIEQIANLAFPGLHRRLFRRSLLEEDANIAKAIGELDGLESEIRKLVRRMHGSV